MASNPRVVCWRTREEWMKTYENLFNFEKPHLQRKGTERVEAWKSRSGGKLPLAVESTSNLIAAHLAVGDHSSGESDASLVSSGFVEKKLLLAMALLRFVNGMVDLEQKGMYARSMQSIAEEIGLPDWLIDLRHEATHAHLPSLEILLSGLRVALSWLRAEYWEAQITKHDINKEKIVQLLKDYKDRAMLVMATEAKKPSKKTKVNKKSESMKSACTEIVQEIASLASSSNSWSDIISALLDDQLLSCTQEDLAKLEVEWPEPNRNQADFLPTLPSKVVNLWKPLFEALCKMSSEVIPSFLIGLLEYLPEVRGSQSSEELAGWVGCFLAPSLSTSSVEALETTENFPWFTLLEQSLKCLSPYTSAIISVVLQNMPEIPNVLQQKIKTLPLVFLDTNNDLHHNEKRYSVDDVNELFAEKRRKRTDKMKTSEKVDQEDTQEMWTSASGLTLWREVPLGEVLGVEESPNNLELFQELVGTAVSFEHQINPRVDQVVHSSSFVENITETEDVTEGDFEVTDSDLVVNNISPMESETVENSDNNNTADNIWLF